MENNYRLHKWFDFLRLQKTDRTDLKVVGVAVVVAVAAEVGVQITEEAMVGEIETAPERTAETTTVVRGETKTVAISSMKTERTRLQQMNLEAPLAGARSEANHLAATSQLSAAIRPTDLREENLAREEEEVVEAVVEGAVVVASKVAVISVERNENLTDIVAMIKGKLSFCFFCSVVIATVFHLKTKPHERFCRVINCQVGLILVRVLLNQKCLRAFKFREYPIRSVPYSRENIMPRIVLDTILQTHQVMIFVKLSIAADPRKFKLANISGYIIHTYVGSRDSKAIENI